MTPFRQPLPRNHPDRTDPRRKAWRQFMALHALLTPIMDEELKAKSDIDLNTYDALLHLFEAGQSGLRMNALADTIVMSRSGLTTLVDRLADRGLVERVPDPDDRRATRIRLTNAGEETFRSAAAVHLASIERHFLELVDTTEAAQMAEVFDRVIAHHLTPDPPGE